MRTGCIVYFICVEYPYVGMKPLSERDENSISSVSFKSHRNSVGMKPLSERDENHEEYL